MSTERPILFLGGVPGSGKSYVCRELAESVPGARHEIAGHLIRRALTGGTNGYRRPLVKDDVAADRFQELLIEEFLRVREAHTGPILLDGHYIIPTENGPSKVNASVFRRLHITQLALLDIDPGVVAKRLQRRERPRWWDGRLDTIEDLARLEREQAAHIGRQLRLAPIVLSALGATEQLLREVFAAD